MSRFSPSDAALEGFRLTREHPLSVLIWAAIRLLFGVASLVLLFGLGGSSFQQLVALENAPIKPSPEAVMALMGPLAAPFLSLGLLGLVFYAVTYTAILRAILRPADRSFGYLRLSIDEARQFALAIIVFLLFMVYMFIASLISGVLIALSARLGQAAPVVQVALILALIVAFIYPAMRLSLAPAMTFADGRITLFRSLPVTKGHFWPIFGAYMLALALTVIVVLLAAVIFTFVIGAIGMAQGGISALPSALGMMQPNDMTLKGFLAPLRLVNLAFSAVLGTLAYLTLFAPAAAIFRELTGRVGAATLTTSPGQPWGGA